MRSKRNAAEAYTPGRSAAVRAPAHVGTVRCFDRTYGFLTPDDPAVGKSVFVHFAGIVGNSYKTLTAGQRVAFDIEQSDKGPRAVRVTPFRGEFEQSA